MNFQESLKDLVSNVKGAEGAILMGFDGIPVAEAKADHPSIVFSDLAVEYSRLLSESLKVAQANSLGGTKEFVLSTDRAQFVFHVLKDNYFLGLLLSPDGLVGKGKFLLRKLAPEIQKDL